MSLDVIGVFDIFRCKLDSLPLVGEYSLFDYDLPIPEGWTEPENLIEKGDPLYDQILGKTVGEYSHFSIKRIDKKFNVQQIDVEIPEANSKSSQNSTNPLTIDSEGTPSSKQINSNLSSDIASIQTTLNSILEIINDNFIQSSEQIKKLTESADFDQIILISNRANQIKQFAVALNSKITSAAQDLNLIINSTNNKD